LPAEYSMSGNFHDRTAFLASVCSGASVRRFQFLEFIVPVARTLDTFGTKTISEFVGIEGQMTMLAPEGSLSHRQQFKRFVIARSHHSQ
jgi:hypothetical protein